MGSAPHRFSGLPRDNPGFPATPRHPPGVRTHDYRTSHSYANTGRQILAGSAAEGAAKYPKHTSTNTLRRPGPWTDAPSELRIYSTNATFPFHRAARRHVRMPELAKRLTPCNVIIRGPLGCEVLQRSSHFCPSPRLHTSTVCIIVARRPPNPAQIWPIWGQSRQNLDHLWPMLTKLDQISLRMAKMLQE